MNSPLSWATALVVLICLIWFMRMLAVLYQNGKLDQAAKLVFRTASLFPLAIMVVSLALAGIGLALSTQTIRFIPWAMLLIVLGGTIWAIERGMRAVRKSRAS